MRYTHKYKDVLFVVGNDNEMDVLKQGKAEK